MFRRKVNNSLCGVLNDFDLSIPVTRVLTSKQRTGTTPYMAVDLLENPPTTHLYRHDLESLFYVIVVLTSRYHKGREMNEKPPLQAWFDLGGEALAEAKLAFLYLPAPQPTPDFQKIENAIGRMRKMFRDASVARADHYDKIHYAKMRSVVATEKQAIPEFDESTLGGHVDFNKFGEILDEAII